MTNYPESIICDGVNMLEIADAADIGGCLRPRQRSKTAYRFVKRSIDILISFTALVVLAIPFIIIYILILLEKDGSPIFCQRRIGKNGRIFNIYKFRTMSSAAPSEMATEQFVQPEDFITRIGGMLRKTSLDELPQLLNVFKGDMSLIGPRPLILSEIQVHKLRSQAGVYSIRPGITGWAQVNGRDVVTANEKVAFDKEYVDNMSLVFDLKVLLRSVKVVVTREGYMEGARERVEACQAEMEDGVSTDDAA